MTRLDDPDGQESLGERGRGGDGLPAHTTSTRFNFLLDAALFLQHATLLQRQMAAIRLVQHVRDRSLLDFF